MTAPAARRRRRDREVDRAIGRPSPSCTMRTSGRTIRAAQPRRRHLVPGFRDHCVDAIPAPTLRLRPSFFRCQSPLCSRSNDEIVWRFSSLVVDLADRLVFRHNNGHGGAIRRCRARQQRAVTCVARAAECIDDHGRVGPTIDLFERRRARRVGLVTMRSSRPSSPS